MELLVPVASTFGADVATRAHFRRVATRYEKTALSFAAMLFSVGAAI